MEMTKKEMERWDWLFGVAMDAILRRNKKYQEMPATLAEMCGKIADAAIDERGQRVVVPDETETYIDDMKKIQTNLMSGLAYMTRKLEATKERWCREPSGISETQESGGRPPQEIGAESGGDGPDIPPPQG